MSEHKAFIRWQADSDDFAYTAYSRTHHWIFEGGSEIMASAAPQYRGNIAYVNPEEALVAALSSCHMLTFLAIASRKKITVKAYEDHASGVMEKNDRGKLAVTRVYLRPKIQFAENHTPDKETLDEMHHQSHEECFIANSVLTEIIVAPVYE